MSEDEQIEQIKKNFLTTVDPTTRKKVFDTLEEYGDKGINTINDLIGVTVDTDVKMYGLDIIKRIRSHKNVENKPWEIEGDIASDED